ncbi:hypothetical protein [Microbacterium tumbae]
MLLRRLDALVSLVGDDGLLDGQARVFRVEVEVADSQPGEFAPAQAAVREGEHDEAVPVVSIVLHLVNGPSERRDLIVREAALARLRRLGELESGGRVRRQALVLDRGS